MCSLMVLASVESHLAENVFEVPQAPGHVSVFVHYGGFAFDRPDDLTELFGSKWSGFAQSRTLQSSDARALPGPVAFCRERREDS